jgi:hypothetical protein
MLPLLKHFMGYVGRKQMYRQQHLLLLQDEKLKKHLHRDLDH